MNALTSPPVALSFDGTPAIQCHHCNDWLHRDDFRPQDFTDADIIEQSFGGPVCFGCMDDLVICAGGEIIPRDDAFDDDGIWYADRPYDADDRGDYLFEQARDRRMDEGMGR